MAYESLTEQEQYEMWVHYCELLAYEEEQQKIAGLTSNNINPANIADMLQQTQGRPTPPRQPAQTVDRETESSPSPGF